MIKRQRKLLESSKFRRREISADEWTLLSNDLPRHFMRFDDLLFLSTAECFQHSLWEEIFGDDKWLAIARLYGCDRIACQTTATICSDDFRSPSVRLLHGSSTWVTRRENSVVYHLPLDRCMFSKGNINEKLRMASLDCAGQVIFDLFAGIGYFTLPLLVHTKAQLVYACDWNPASVEALKRALVANRIEANRYRVLHGDCRLVAPCNVADRCLLGLLPSADIGISPALRALKTSGGTLHIHSTADRAPSLRPYRARVEEIISLLAATDSTRLYTVDQVVRVKSYAPRVDHIVVDVLVTVLGAAAE